MANMSWNRLMLEVSNAISELNSQTSLTNGAATAAQQAATQANEAAQDALDAAEAANEAAQQASDTAALWGADVEASVTLKNEADPEVKVETVETGETNADGTPRTAKRFAFTLPTPKKGDTGAQGDTGESGVTFEMRDGTKLYITTNLT